MDIFGTVLSTIELVTKIVGYLQAVKGAKKDRLELLSEASALRALLDILHRRLGNPSDGGSDSGALDMLVKAGIGGALDQCYQALRSTVEELERIASYPKAGTSPSFTVKLRDARWPFRQEEIRTTLSKIERLKSLISLAFQTSLMEFIDMARDELAIVGLNVEGIKSAVSTLEADHRAHMKQTESLQINLQALKVALQDTATLINRNQQVQIIRGDQVQADVRIIREGVSGQELQEILKWLSPLDFGEMYNTAFEKHAPGTGNWFLKHPKFLSWRRGEYNTLWCPGNPGVGKSVMASLVIHELQKDIPEDTAVVFIYFEYTTNYTIVQLLEAILKQLVRRRVTRPGVESLRAHKAGSRPTLDELFAILKVEMRTYTRVFVVIDALDETSTRVWIPFLEHLRTLSAGVSLLATSRDLGDIAAEFRDERRLDVMAREGDMRKYIEGRLKGSTGALQRLLKANGSLHGEIVAGIMGKADGMFLLAQLHMNSLETRARITDLRRALSELPGDLKSAYDATMARITDEDRPLAYLIISWVLRTFEPMTIHDLQYALAVKDGATVIDADDLYDEAHLTSICAGLVILQQEMPRYYHRRGKVIGFVHYSTREYLREHVSAQLPHPTHLAVTCLRYLSFDIFGADDWLPLMTSPLVEYAIDCWGDYAREYYHDPIIQGLAMAILCDKRKVSLLGFVFDDLDQDISAIHLCTYLGLGDYLEYLLVRGFDLNSKDTDGDTPVTYAAIDGQSDVMRLLLSREDVDVNPRGWNGAIPLTRAVMNERQDIVELLLARDGVDVNSRDNDGSTPVAHAARRGYDGIVKLLLAREDLDINLQDQGGYTPLAQAILGGHEAVVRLLLGRNDLDINLRDNDGDTHLAIAAGRGGARVIKLLLAKGGVDVNAKNHAGLAALSVAALRGHSTVVGLLLTHDSIDIHSVDLDGNTPLDYAEVKGHQGVINILRATGGCTGVELRSNPQVGLAGAV